MKNILVTGGAGFIGSNFVPYFIANNEEYHLVNLDALTYAGNLENLREVENHPRYSFVQGDICDRTFIEDLFANYQFHKQMVRAIPQVRYLFHRQQHAMYINVHMFVHYFHFH